MRRLHASIFAIFATGIISVQVRADALPPLPGSGFSGDRYTTLWTKSPFAIATQDASAATQDYQLVGIAQFDGISFVSLIDKKSSEHFVLSSDKPVKNLQLVSVSHGAGGSGTATILRNGETLTLQQEQASVTVTNPPPLGSPGMPISVSPQVDPSVGGVRPTLFHRPPVRIHRPTVVVPRPPSSP